MYGHLEARMITTLRQAPLTIKTENRASKSELLREISARAQFHTKRASIESLLDNPSGKPLNSSF